MMLHWHCPACGLNERSPDDLAILRLHGIGRLKRIEKVNPDLLIELARLSAQELNCGGCGAAGVTLVAGEPPQDDFGERRCEVCARPIDPDRLEVFPDTTVCTACQRRDERGIDPTEPDYCPHCGTPREVVKSTAGITRFQVKCPACRR